MPMKNKVILTLVYLLFGTVCSIVIAKDIHPFYLPKEVKVKFKSLYPDITEGINWQKKSNKYQADFIFYNKSISLVFHKNGKLLNSRIEIDVTEVPPLVYLNVKNSFIDKNYKILYVIKKSEWRKDFPEGNRDFYEVEVMKGRLMYIVRYSKEGKVLNIFELDKRDILDERWYYIGAS
jgi:hypothetical protein